MVHGPAGVGQIHGGKLVSRKATGPIILISMDSIRKKIFPNSTYSDQERDAAYRSFVLIASSFREPVCRSYSTERATSSIWRKFARQECPKFVEVYLKCPIEICIERESKRTNNSAVRRKLYATALARLKKGKRIRGLGKMPGVDERYEESPTLKLFLTLLSRNRICLRKELWKSSPGYAPDTFSI